MQGLERLKAFSEHNFRAKIFVICAKKTDFIKKKDSKLLQKCLYSYRDFVRSEKNPDEDLKI